MSQAPTATASPLLRMTQETPTQYWCDSCAADQLAYSIERGATGATSNPSIVLEVMRRERDHWEPRVSELASTHPTWSEVDLAWAVSEEIAVHGAAALAPVFERTHRQAGRLSFQVNPANHRSPERMVEQAVRFAALAPNIQVKLPVTAAGLVAIEEATARGINITATVSFTVAQAVAAAEAIERGLDRRAAAVDDGTVMAPMVVLMIGRLDDWMKILVERDGLAVHPAAPSWAGIAVFKRTYALFQERGYRSHLLSAAYRHRLHWTELVGADASLTLTHGWQVRFNASGIEPKPRIDIPVDPSLVDDLSRRVPDFRRAYEPDGMTPDEFEGYGASARTLRAFIQSYHDLQAAIRDLVLPDPGARRA